MEIVVNSNAPWLEGSGYGQQTALLAVRLQALGHTVTISAPYSAFGAVFDWHGMTVLPGGLDAFGADVIRGHYEWAGADLMITLCDVFAMDTERLRGLHVAHWMPVDCAKLGAGDRAKLGAGGGVPIAMSRFGETRLRGAGFEPLFAPHGIDTSLFSPAQDRDELRDSIGIGANTFLIGINAVNKDSGNRKALPEQLMAFARFHAQHENTALVVHSHANTQPVGGLNLKAITDDLGISDAVMFPDQHDYISGMTGNDVMADWYRVLDVYLGATKAEGFGLPPLEAQASGVPVIVTDCSALTELCGSGWLVQGEPEWASGHASWWVRPSIQGIVDALEQAYAEWPMDEAQGKQAREFALGYDVDTVFEKYWKPVLGELEDRFTGPPKVRAARTLRDDYTEALRRPTDMQAYMPVLYETAKRYPQVAVTELGVRDGCSTAAFLAAADEADGHVQSVELGRLNVPGRWHASGRWLVQVADDMADEVHPWPCDVLFIDTSHEYEHTLAELRKFVPSVRPGGVVLMHDTINWPGNGVVKALDAYCAEAGLVWEEIGHGRYGLGQIKIPEAAGA